MAIPIQNNGSSTPINELDMQMRMTDPQWGTDNVSQDLKNKLIKILNIQESSDGQTVITKEDLWGVLSYYTRDMRLANLSVFDGEYNYCVKHLELAGDCLSAGYIESFLACLRRVINCLELSQSKGGFLRRRLGTFTSETYQQALEPTKKNLFGGKKKEY
jgi:hypothetical protein